MMSYWIFSVHYYSIGSKLIHCSTGSGRLVTNRMADFFLSASCFSYSLEFRHTFYKKSAFLNEILSHFSVKIFLSEHSRASKIYISCLHGLTGQAKSFHLNILTLCKILIALFPFNLCNLCNLPVYSRRWKTIVFRTSFLLAHFYLSIVRKVLT